MLTLDGMEQSLVQVQPLLEKRSIYECVQYFSKEADIEAKQSEKAYALTQEKYEQFLKTEPTKDPRTLRMTARKEKNASDRARQYAEKAKAIKIPEKFHARARPVRILSKKVRGAPMRISFKSRP